MDEAEARSRIASVTDGRGLPVDEGIREACVWFMVAGFELYASCEGHADRGTYPWIQFEAADNTPAGNAPYRERVAALLAGAEGLVMEDQGIFGAFRVQPAEGASGVRGGRG